MDHNSRVFASIFPVLSLSHTTPTPIATPEPGYAAPGQSFGSPFVKNTGVEHRAVKRNLAWSTATRFLSLPNINLGSLKATPRTNAAFDAQRALLSTDVEEALRYLLVGEGKSEDGQEDGLIEWYTIETRIHFSNSVKPALTELWKDKILLGQVWDVLDETLHILEHIQKVYIQPFNDHILPFLRRDTSSASTILPSRSVERPEPSEAEAADWRFRRDIHVTFAHSVPPQRFSKTLGYLLYDAGCRMFSIYARRDGVQSSATPENVKAVRQRMVKLLQQIEHVGLGGDAAQKAFAQAMDKLLDSFIVSHYTKVDWYSRESVVPHLRTFIKDGFTPLVELVMECLKSDPSDVQPAELQTWQDMALGRLGRVRVDNLFDYMIHWDQSLGAILDIKEYLRTPNAKQHVTASFSQQISRRLLHQGATTTYILNLYINIVRAFHVLEPKGVLLERVARPIRRYLKEREDTARIIISSLLADINDETGNKFASGGELSYEIASEMQKPFANFNPDADEELDWNDLNWQPLPMDASPDYKKSKVEDVIWFLLTLWDREDFINELKNILGEHLLGCEDPEYEKEIRLLELIKVRLGDEKLQACEVMLRDVLDSKRINGTIKASGPLHPTDKHVPQTPEIATPRTPRSRRLNPSSLSTSRVPLEVRHTSGSKPIDAPDLNARILSSFFWPLLRDDHFLVPSEIQVLQREYGSRFERIKGMRKLRWMNALGEGTITLEFQDRTEEFTHLMPWQVSVVYAFQPQPGEEIAAGNKKGYGKGKQKEQTITRNVSQLESMLEMDGALVRQALSFWVGQSVLREVSPSTYSVIENLSSTTNSSDADAAAAAQELAEVQAQQQAGAVKSQADLLMERKAVYEAFITGMLTNQGNLPVQRITMMMRMMVQGGFPFGIEEVRYLLGQLEVEEKVMAMGGDMWGIRK